MSIVDEVEIGVRSRVPAMYLVSYEERRALAMLVEASKRIIFHDRLEDGTVVKIQCNLFTWSIASGLSVYDREHETYVPIDEDCLDPTEILDNIQEVNGQAGIYVLLDYHEFLKSDLVVRRKFREASMKTRTMKKTMVVLSPVLHIPDELEKTITVIDVPLPSREELQARVDKVIRRGEGTTTKGVEFHAPSQEIQDRIVSSSIGLTMMEMDQCVGRAFIQHLALDERTIAMAEREKAQIVKKSGLMEFLNSSISFNDVGGNDLLKKYITRRKRAFSKEAREFGLDTPKGILYIGPPGIGKSLVAKATSDELQLPLLRLDVGALFGGLVGESESNVRKFIETAEAVAPCVVWIDEIEKGFAGMSGSGSSDGGTTSRVFSTILTWMSEKTSDVFIFATANDVTALPPELLRKGRFDEIFAADLPVKSEREQILGIHLSRRKRDPSKFDLGSIADKTEGFSGAELEALVIDAMFTAFDNGRDLLNQDIIEAADVTVPLSRTMPEKIKALQEWARTRARSASSHHFNSATAPKKRSTRKKKTSKSVLDGMFDD